MQVRPWPRPSLAPTQVARPRTRTLAFAAVALVLCLAAPMLAAGKANLTSDESLYLAEAYSIAHGHGPRYPSGVLVTHRAPAFPAMLAPVVRVAGPDAAYTVTKAIVVANVLLLMLAASRMRGPLAAGVTGVTAGSSAFLNGFGPTLYLDPAQCLFLIAALLFLHEALRDARLRWFLASGCAAGAAFLVKESAIQWAPLALVAWPVIPALRSRTAGRGALVFTAALGAIVAAWFLWVWIATSHIYLIGDPTLPHVALLAFGPCALAAGAVGLGAWPRAPRRWQRGLSRAAPMLASAVVIAWVAFVVAGLTRYSSWPYPNAYWRTLPHYLLHTAPEAQPFGLFVLAWAWCAYRASRGDATHRLIALAGALFLPIALVAANRGLQLRDALPLVYLSYLLLGIATADVAPLLGAHAGGRAAVAMAVAIVIAGTGFVVQQEHAFIESARAYAPDDVRSNAWDNEFAQESAAWMRANLPPGARVLSSRLYFSSLYVETGGEFEIRQLPTVRVDLHPQGPELLTAESDLFRWGDDAVRPTQAGDQWLDLRQFPGKGYWVGLSQQELLAYIEAHGVQYVVLTGDDGVFSSLSYAGYFSSHPGFRLVHTAYRSPSDQLFVYEVTDPHPQPIAFPATLGPDTLAALEQATGLDQSQLAARLGVGIRVSDAEYGLSERERNAAVAGRAAE